MLRLRGGTNFLPSQLYSLLICPKCKIYLLLMYIYDFHRLLNPVLKRLDKSKLKELEEQIQKQFDPVNVCIYNFNYIFKKLYFIVNH